jgi:hypothetical protein
MQWNKQLWVAAAEAGHLTIVRKLREHGCRWGPHDAHAMSLVAASSGSLPLLPWLRSQGIAYTEHTMAGAVARGHIELCQLLRAEGCRWSTRVTFQAAKHGQLPALAARAGLSLQRS